MPKQGGRAPVLGESDDGSTLENSPKAGSGSPTLPQAKASAGTASLELIVEKKDKTRDEAVKGNEGVDGARSLGGRGPPGAKELDGLFPGGGLWFFVGDQAAISGGILLSYYYDSSSNRAVLAFYDPVSRRVVYWFDKTDHKPFFIVRETPEEVEQRIPPELRARVDHVETITRYNLLHMRRETYSKVVVTDPLAVRELRDRFGERWEADIKYHQNYIYDHRLVPGLQYDVNGRRITPRIPTVEEADLRERLRDMDGRSFAYARELYTYLEQEPPLPPMMAVDIEVYSPITGRLPDTKSTPYPIISAAIATSDGVRTVLVLASPSKAFEKPPRLAVRGVQVVVYGDEASLLRDLFALMSRYPVVITFNGDNFDLPYLRNRALKLGFREEEVPLRPEQDYYTLKGGIHIDLYPVFDNKALKTYAYGGSYRENNLDAIAEALLGRRKLQLTKEISELGLEELVEYNYRDAELTLELMAWKNWLTWKLLVVLGRLAKTGVEDLSRSQISIWVRNMFYWEHRKRGFIIPNKDDLLRAKGETRSRAIIKGKKYAGAIVIDPPVGVFFDVYVLDFASLYPTIIKNWNLSYETVNPQYPCKSQREVPEVGHRVCFDREGLTSQIIGVIRDLRVRVFKKKKKDKSLPPEKREWYDVVQSSLKVFINASYGVFGSDAFALYTPPVAESVTAVGRHIIRSTIRRAAELGLMVLYGDTDSMFLWAPRREAMETLVEEVATIHRLELEVDKHFRFAAFSGLKKNYLGVTDEGEAVIKGMLGKKRNQPEFIKKSFREVVEDLAGVREPRDFEKAKTLIIDKLKDIYTRLKNRGYTLDELAFNMMLNKGLNEYDKNTPQHVKAALMLKPFGKHLSRGDIISFVKVKTREGVKPVQLAKLNEVDIAKYVEAVKSTFEQVLQALNVEWKEIEGVSRIESFFTRMPRSPRALKEESV